MPRRKSVRMVCAALVVYISLNVAVAITMPLSRRIRLIECTTNSTRFQFTCPDAKSFGFAITERRGAFTGEIELRSESGNAVSQSFGTGKAFLWKNEEFQWSLKFGPTNQIRKFLISGQRHDGTITFNGALPEPATVLWLEYKQSALQKWRSSR